MIVELPTEHHLEFLSLKAGCTGSSESTHVKMPHCWKSHATAHFQLQVVSPPDDSVSCLKFGPGTMGSTFLIAGSWDNNVSIGPGEHYF